jgi:hypothetical protein
MADFPQAWRQGAAAVSTRRACSSAAEGSGACGSSIQWARSAPPGAFEVGGEQMWYPPYKGRPARCPRVPGGRLSINAEAGFARDELSFVALAAPGSPGQTRRRWQLRGPILSASPWMAWTRVSLMTSGLRVHRGAASRCCRRLQNQGAGPLHEPRHGGRATKLAAPLVPRQGFPTPTPRRPPGPTPSAGGVRGRSSPPSPRPRPCLARRKSGCRVPPGVAARPMARRSAGRRRHAGPQAVDVRAPKPRWSKA